MKRMVFICITWIIGMMCGFALAMSILLGFWMITIISALTFAAGAIFFSDKDVIKLIREKSHPDPKY